jgi:ribonuclease Y
MINIGTLMFFSAVPLAVGVGVGALLLGAVLGFVVKKAMEKSQIETSKLQATNIIQQAENEAQTLKNEAILEAQVEYENEKAIINEKETRIDLRMDTLKTELEAINTMLKSMENIKKDNIDRTMNITG